MPVETTVAACAIAPILDAVTMSPVGISNARLAVTNAVLAMVGSDA